MFIKLVKKSEGFYWNIDFILVFTICSKYHNNMLNIIEIYIHKRKYIHGENDFSWSFMNKSRWNTLDFILICNLSGIILQWRCWNSAKFHFFNEPVTNTCHQTSLTKLENAVSYKRVLYRSNAVVTVPIMFLSHYIKRYKIDSMQPNPVLPESKYGNDGEMAQNSKRNWIRGNYDSNLEPSQNQMHMLARVIVSFDDFLSHLTILPELIESPIRFSKIVFDDVKMVTALMTK